ncbi:MAG: glycosyl transferase family 1 [Litorilinea sp.]|nr:MAG: glycosyl transferase family 1 [Litorilinea sp.]
MSQQTSAAAEVSPTDSSNGKRYRVLMIAPTSFFADYGCHVRILEEARILQKLGHQVTIVTYRNGQDVPGLDIRRTLPIPWRTHYEVGSSRHKIAFDALLGVETLALLARRRFDVIHAHLHEGALIGLVLGRLFGIPTVFDFQGSLTEEMIDHHFLRRESPFYPPLRSLETWITRSAPVILTSTGHARRFLLEQFHCRPEQIRALPDCVNADVFRPADDFPPEELAALRSSLGIPADARVIVYLGLLAEYQGTGLLLEAVERILRHHSNVYLLLMGFPSVQLYRAKAEALGIGHAVITTGRIPYQEAPRYLALGHVAAAPKLSLTEGSGKLLNYMATALPTVAFDTPVAREYLGADGLLAKRGDVESLAEQLSAALFPPPGQADRYRACGQRLRRRVIQHFDWEQAGREIVAIYRQLREGHHQPLPTQRREQPGLD